jgi:hypothetical protein
MPVAVRQSILKENKGDLENAFELYERILSISPNDEQAGKVCLRLRLELLIKDKSACSSIDLRFMREVSYTPRTPSPLPVQGHLTPEAADR